MALFSNGKGEPVVRTESRHEQGDVTHNADEETVQDPTGEDREDFERNVVSILKIYFIDRAAYD